MIFYKFIVTKDSWSAEFAITQERIDFSTSDSEEIKDLYEDYKEDVWIAYNANDYHRHLLKAVIVDLDPVKVHEFIMGGGSGWQYSEVMNHIPLNSYDAMLSKQYSLKQLTAFQGKKINDSVEDLMDVFIQQLDTFISRLEILLEFKISLKNIDKSETQLIALILRARKINRYDEWDINILDHDLGKYEHTRYYYKNDDETLETEIAGVKHKYGLGGLHGAVKNYLGKGLFIYADCKSMYPNIISKYRFMSRNVNYPQKYDLLLKKRLELKRHSDSKHKTYKLIINKGFGAIGDPFNLMYDLRMYHNIVINGQLFMTDLIDKLEPYIELIQTNTDGIVFKINEDDFDTIDGICSEWESRTGLTLEFKYFDLIYQKDVNNYIFIGDEIITAGAYVKQLSPLDNDLPIVNKAVRDYFIFGTDTEDTINNSNSLIDFQMIIKAEAVKYGRETYDDKVYRFYAAKNGDHALKFQKGKLVKIPLLSDFCKMIQEDVRGMEVPNWLDRQWYIDLANKRIRDFMGIKNTAKNDSVVEQISFW